MRLIFLLTVLFGAIPDEIYGQAGVMKNGECHTNHGIFWTVDPGNAADYMDRQDLIDKCIEAGGLPALINKEEQHQGILQCYPASSRVSRMYTGLVDISLGFGDGGETWLVTDSQGGDGLPATDGYSDHINIASFAALTSCGAYPSDSNTIVGSNCSPASGDILLCIKESTDDDTTSRPSTEGEDDDGNGEGEGCQCPDHWLREGEMCYMVSHEPATWMQANAKCHYSGGMLINTQDHEAKEVAMQYGKRAPEWMWLSLISKAKTYWTNGEMVEIGRGNNDKDPKGAGLRDFVRANKHMLMEDLEDILEEDVDVAYLLKKLMHVLENYMKMEYPMEMKEMKEGEADSMMMMKKVQMKYKMICYIEMLLEEVQDMFWDLNDKVKMSLEVVKCAVGMLKKTVMYDIENMGEGLYHLAMEEDYIKTMIMNIVDVLKDEADDIGNGMMTPMPGKPPMDVMQYFMYLKEMEAEDLMDWMMVHIEMPSGQLEIDDEYMITMKPGEHGDYGKNDSMTFVYPPNMCMQCGAFATEMCMASGEQNMLYVMLDCMQPRHFICQMHMHCEKEEETDMTPSPELK